MNKLLAFAICGFVPLAAQQSPSPDDPGLLVMFFRFHSGLSSALDDKKTQDPSSGAKAEKAVAHTLKVPGFRPAADRRCDPCVCCRSRQISRRNLKAYVDESRGEQPRA